MAEKINQFPCPLCRCKHDPNDPYTCAKNLVKHIKKLELTLEDIHSAAEDVGMPWRW